MNPLENSACRALALTLLLVAVTLTGAGCSDDDPVVPLPPVGPWSPEQLMADFRSVYEDRDIDGFRKVIHPDFLIFLSQSTVDEFALPREFFDFDEEAQIAERMFSGSPFIRQDGNIVPGITRIRFDYFAPETAWELAGPEDRFPLALCALYRVEIRVEQGNVGMMTIRGLIEFAVRSEQVQVNGALRDRWRMVGQVDYTDAPRFDTTGPMG